MSFAAEADSGSQAKTPIVDALQALACQPDAAFYAPGHKRGQGISQPLENLLGKAVFRADLPELPQLDNLFDPQGVIEEAQALAAEAFGAQKTWFLINGSTCGVIAAILATCGTGDKIILPRNIHQSAIAGLVFSGAVPVFINPEYDSELALAYSVTPEAVRTALIQHPDAKAVMIVYPTYEGVCGDIAAIAQVTHKYNLPLLVDEAHGAHFTFHSCLPPSALSVGADLTVQSTHKVLGAMTQASMLHLQGCRIKSQQISQALGLLQSTSPSYLLLASLDAARQQMALQGQALMTRTLQLAADASEKIAQIPDLSVLKAPKSPVPGFFYLDTTRLTVDIADLGLSGYEADEIFYQQLGVTAELPAFQHLTFIISLGNTADDIKKLIRAFKALQEQSQSVGAKPPRPDGSWLSAVPAPCAQISPRDAFFTLTQSLPLNETIGCTSAELVCPYPPGIPLLMPGEIVSFEAINYLKQVLAAGGIVTGCSDRTVESLKVVAGT